MFAMNHLSSIFVLLRYVSLLCYHSKVVLKMNHRNQYRYVLVQGLLRQVQMQPRADWLATH